MRKSAAKIAAPGVAKDGTRRGGARPGAGRKPKKLAEPTSLAELDLRALIEDAPPEEIDALAQRHLGASIEGLAKIVVYGQSETARISCCKEILDRGWGKPAVEIGGDAAPMLPLMMAPSVQPASAGVTAQFRDAARRYGRLAIEVLHRIAEHGKSETARAAAWKALNERGLGTVAAARMPEEAREEQLGKKEQRQRAAETAATGKYATRPLPRSLADTLQ